MLDSAREVFRFEKVKAAIEYDNKAELSGEIAEKLFAPAISSSATKLRSFASCPYQHFAKYILKLKERRIFELKPLDLGQFFHSVLERLFYKLKNSELSFSSVQTELLKQYVDSCVEELLIENAFLRSFKGKSRHNSYIIDSASEVIKDAAVEFSQIARAGRFTQIASETVFGSKSNLPAVEI